MNRAKALLIISVLLLMIFSCDVRAVTYDANGGSGAVPVDTVDYKYSKTGIVLDNSGGLNKDWDVFVGWNTSPDGSGEDYFPGQEVNAEITLYAMYSPAFDMDPEVIGDREKNNLYIQDPCICEMGIDVYASYIYLINALYSSGGFNNYENMSSIGDRKSVV